MTRPLDERLDSAIADLDQALVKLFTAMPDRMKQKYELTGEQIQIAIAFAMLSCASMMLTARADAEIKDGLALRTQLRGVASKWLLEHTAE